MTGERITVIGTVSFKGGKKHSRDFSISFYDWKLVFEIFSIYFTDGKRERNWLLIANKFSLLERMEEIFNYRKN